MVRITYVKPQSMAAKAGVKAGDWLVAINGKPAKDFLDYMASSHLSVRTFQFRGKNHRFFEVVDKKVCEFGLMLEEFRNTPCRNRCVFCFVDQLPPGLRKSLYEKDEDYRLSFLYGNYVTLTDITPAALQRIVDLHLSPVYVSVHTTDPELRGKMLGRRGPAPIVPILQFLVRHRIQIHCQIVICSGLNTGRHLSKTLDNLEKLFPGVASVAVAPVGLTRFRKKLPKIKSPSGSEAKRIAEACMARAKKLRRKYGRGMIYPTDEMFLMARKPLPPAGFYDGFCQLQNGAGTIRCFEEEVHAFLRKWGKHRRHVTGMQQVWVCGTAGQSRVKAVARRFSRSTGLKVKVLPVRNCFFGDKVTVSGLLTGRDIAQALYASRWTKARVILPRDCVNADHITLDGWCVGEIQEVSGQQSVEVFKDFEGLV